MISMNIQDAAYHTAHDVPGGIAAIAARMGISPNVLQNKVNPTQDHHKLTLAEAVKIQALTGDCRILHAMAASLNHVALPVLHFEGIADMALLDGYMDVITELGEFTATFQTAISDGEVSHKEFARLESESYDVIQRLLALMQRIAGLAQPASFPHGK
jgi:hypothetical protein